MARLSSQSILLVAVLVLVRSVGAWAAEPLVKEGFEGGTAGWSVWSAKKTATFTQDTSEAKEGKASAKVASDNNEEMISVYKYVPVEAGKRYVLRLQYKLKDVQVIPGRSIGALMNFNKAGGGNGSAGNQSFKFDTSKPTADWQPLEQTFTVPAEAVRAQFVIVGMGRATGCVWIDDVVLEPAD